MVQEFHVLRCFSCQTFQVQQVKKSNKWSCKMCGEKQSIIKEYGRGTGADCRRHVQKLNSLRGALLEVDGDRLCTRSDMDEEREVEVSPEDETRSWRQKGQTQALSRWSKYVDRKENGPESEEDEIEEKERVDNTASRYQHNNSRKRKKSFTAVSYGRCTVEADEDKDAAHWRSARQPSQPRRHDSTFRSPLQVSHSCHTSVNLSTGALCASPAASLGPGDISASSDICPQFTGANKLQCFAELGTEPQRSGPSSSFFAPSFSHQQLGETKLEAKGSKWARFLPSVRVEDEDEGDTGEHAQYLDEAQTTLASSPVMPVASVLPNNTESTSSGRSEGALLDRGCGVKECVNENVCEQILAITSQPVGSGKPVCLQPLPLRNPALSAFSTLFHTDDDFDDAY